MMRYSNPWAVELVETESRLGMDGNLQGAKAEAERANAYPPERCGACGSNAYMKPSIGAYKCPACGALRDRDGQWVAKRNGKWCVAVAIDTKKETKADFARRAVRYIEAPAGCVLTEQAKQRMLAACRSLIAGSQVAAEELAYLERVRKYLPTVEWRDQGTE